VMEPKPAVPAAATKPAAAQAAVPAEAAPIVTPAAETATAMSDLDEWELPIECFHCRGTYAVPLKHFRTGVVFYCPSCQGSYVVTSSMHNHVSQAVREFQARRKKELEDFEERRRAQLAVFNESLKKSSHEFRPPGAPRKRAWIFG
jgi:hypothetical protein